MTCTKLSGKKRETTYFEQYPPFLEKKKHVLLFLHRVFFFCSLAEIFFHSSRMRKKSALSTFHYLWTCLLGKETIKYQFGKVTLRQEGVCQKVLDFNANCLCLNSCWDFSWCHPKAPYVQWTALKWGNTERAHNTGSYMLISIMATSVLQENKNMHISDTILRFVFGFLHCPKWVVSFCAPPCDS